MATDAKRYAYKLLGYRGRSESELRDRLTKKGYPEDIISGTLEHLRQAGYVDDTVLAVNLARQAQKNRLLGHEGARRFLLKRGIPPEVIETTLAYDEDSELQGALRLMEKKVKSEGYLIPLSERRRLWNFLVRRGYSLDTIKKTFHHYTIHQEVEE